MKGHDKSRNVLLLISGRKVGRFIYMIVFNKKMAKTKGDPEAIAFFEREGIDALLDRVERGEADIKDFPEEALLRDSLTNDYPWPNDARLYSGLYGNGRGDLFTPFKKLVEVGQSIPVDFEVVKHGIDDDQFTLFGNRFLLPEDETQWARVIGRLSPRYLGGVVDFLNGIYKEPSAGRLRFSLGEVTTTSTEDNIFDYFWDRKGQGYILGPTDRLRVRLVALPFAELEDWAGIDNQEPLGGLYQNRGLIYCSLGEALHPLNPILAHEVGHGIFGYGHHKQRECVMDDGMSPGEELQRAASDLGFRLPPPRNVTPGPGFARQEQYPTFCPQDIAKLRELAGLKS
jgi:hypothetical protein